MAEHEKTQAEIDKLKNEELPKWVKKQKELIQIIKKAKAARDQKIETN